MTLVRTLMSRPLALAAGFLALALVVGLLVLRGSSDHSYHVDLVMPEAEGVYKGMSLRIDNIPAGHVTGVTVQNGKAVVGVDVDSDHAPLHQGTKPVIDYRSLVGEVYLQLKPGPATAPPLPDGSIIDTNWSQVTVEDVLETLNPATRKRLQGLLGDTQSLLSGSTPTKLNATIKAAGPAVDALGQVLRAVSEDGPALHTIVTKLAALVRTTASRRTDLSAAVTAISDLADKVARNRDQLKQGLSELPSTLDQANSTLAEVTPTVNKAEPLLQDLQPAAARLPAVAAQLHPLLTDLQPAARDLRSTLGSTNALLGETPGLLDTADATVPDLNRTVAGLAPTLAFLRPYTPDLIGWLTNWAGVFGQFTSQGHAGHLLATVSATGVNNLPKIDIPGMTFDDTTAPGTSAGQPWTDASGGKVQ